MLSFSLVAEALTGLIYHRPSGENSTLHTQKVASYMRDSAVRCMNWDSLGIIRTSLGIPTHSLRTVGKT